MEKFTLLFNLFNPQLKENDRPNVVANKEKASKITSGSKLDNLLNTGIEPITNLIKLNESKHE